MPKHPSTPSGKSLAGSESPAVVDAADRQEAIARELLQSPEGRLLLFLCAARAPKHLVPIKTLAYALGVKRETVHRLLADARKLEQRAFRRPKTNSIEASRLIERLGLSPNVPVRTNLQRLFAYIIQDDLEGQFAQAFEFFQEFHDVLQLQPELFHHVKEELTKLEARWLRAGEVLSGVKAGPGLFAQTTDSETTQPVRKSKRRTSQKEASSTRSKSVGHARRKRGPVDEGETHLTERKPR